MRKLNAVLFVDDDAICSLLNKSIFEELEIVDSIVCLSNATDALEYLLKATSPDVEGFHCPDLIFLDIKMPDINGFELLERLNEIEQCKDLVQRVVILSSSTHEADLERAAQFSVLAYLEKPLTKAKALDVIEGLPNTSGKVLEQ